MPYTATKTKGGYTVTSPHGTKGRHMTKENADAQMRLLRGIEHNPKFAAKVHGKNAMARRMGM